MKCKNSTSSTLNVYRGVIIGRVIRISSLVVRLNTHCVGSFIQWVVTSLWFDRKVSQKVELNIYCDNTF